MNNETRENIKNLELKDDVDILQIDKKPEVQVSKIEDIEKKYLNLINILHDIELDILKYKSFLYTEETFIKNVKSTTILESKERKLLHDPIVDEYVERVFHRSKFRELSEFLMEKMIEQRKRLSSVDLFSEEGEKSVIRVKYGQ